MVTETYENLRSGHPNFFSPVCVAPDDLGDTTQLIAHY